MIEDELIKIWQSSSNQDRIKFEQSRLMIELQSSLKQLHRWWNCIELSETILAVFGVVISILLLFKIPLILTKLSLALMIICAAYLLFKYQGVKKFKPSHLEDSYLNYLKKNKEYLQVQKKFPEHTSIGEFYRFFQLRYYLISACGKRFQRII